MTNEPIIFKGEKYFPIFNPTVKDLKLVDVQLFVRKNFSSTNPTEQENHYYLKEKDLKKYLSRIVKFNENIKKEHVFETLSSNTEILIHHLKESNFSNDSLILFNEYAKSLSLHLNSQSIMDLVKIVVNGKNINRTLFITMLAQFVAKNLEWTNPVILNKLTLACFFCDLGENLPIENKHHIEIAIELLENVKIHSDIVNAIRHHHEYQDGTGWLKVKKHNIHPFAKIIRVCDDFYDYFKSKEISNGVNYLNNHSPTKYDTNTVAALTALFKNRS